MGVAAGKDGGGNMAEGGQKIKIMFMEVIKHKKIKE